MKDRVSCEIRVAFNECGQEWVGKSRVDTNRDNRWSDLGSAIVYALSMAAEIQEGRVLAEAVSYHFCNPEGDLSNPEDAAFRNAAMAYLDHLDKEVERLNGNS